MSQGSVPDVGNISLVMKYEITFRFKSRHLCLNGGTVPLYSSHPRRLEGRPVSLQGCLSDALKWALLNKYVHYFVDLTENTARWVDYDWGEWAD